MTDTAASDQASTARRIELDVSGMTCMMCARRVEKSLNKVDGVAASVKISSKIATVDAAPDVTVEQLCDAVERAGYHATERTDPAPIDHSPPGGRWKRLVAAAVALLR